MKIYAKTDTGMIRQNNEDAYFYKEKDANNFIVMAWEDILEDPMRQIKRLKF